MLSGLLRNITSSIDSATGGVFRTDRGKNGSSISYTGTGGTPQAVDDDDEEDETTNSNTAEIAAVCLGIASRKK